MNDELNRVKMEEFIGLKRKLYSVLYNDKEMKKSKGVKKNAIKQNVSAIMIIENANMIIKNEHDLI